MTKVFVEQRRLQRVCYKHTSSGNMSVMTGKGTYGDLWRHKSSGHLSVMTVMTGKRTYEDM